MLAAENLKKLYPSGAGLKGISFSVKAGEIAALLGPNGSGKSTTMKILTGILKADFGSCTLQGKNIGDIEVKKQIGYLPENPFIYEGLSPIQFLNFIKSMKGLEGDKKEIDTWLQIFDLWEHRNHTIGTFSLGMKKRVALTAALLGRPKLLILDEPTNGLDTKSLLMLKKAIHELRAAGTAVIISSHVLEFVGGLSDRVFFIREGSLIKEVEKARDCDLEAIYTDIYLKDNLQGGLFTETVL